MGGSNVNPDKIAARARRAGCRVYLQKMRHDKSVLSNGFNIGEFCGSIKNFCDGGV